MDLFSSVVNEKIKEMEDSGAIQKRIEENIEKSINSAIDDVFGRTWSDFNNGLVEKMQKEVPNILKSIDLSSANEFILIKAKDYINSMYERETSEKIINNLKLLFIKKYHGIRITDIYEEFTQMIKDMSNDALDRDKLDIDDDNYCSFIFEINKCEDRFYGSSFDDYSVTIRLNEDDEYICFKFSTWKDNSLRGEDYKKRYIESLDINGKKVDEKFDMSLFNDFELMLINIYLSGTKVDFMELDDMCFETEIELEYIDED
jgi:hypothetical protein|uniref:Uncharacterized protein n=1 Tax=Siphoviridae sp. ctGuJ10 TaxID=2825418 RepID=A0A8S5PTR5_9CAUD|nr:MAG TPA: hypothetical protein [Siphoviridae sp. ctGuJ10]